MDTTGGARSYLDAKIENDFNQSSPRDSDKIHRYFDKKHS